MALQKFWKTELLGKPPLLLLPTDKPRTSTASSLFKVPLEIPADQVSLLAAIGREASAGLQPATVGARSVELSWAVLAAFQVLLARYSRQEDVTVGTAKSAGDHELLPVRVDLESNPKFADLVRQNAAKARQICEHSPVTLAELATAAGADKFDFSSGLHPVFQVAFLLEGSAEASRLSEGFNLDVLLEFSQSGGALKGFLCGKETFFATTTMKRMAQHFKNLVASIVADPQQPVFSLGFVDAAEREKVLETFNATAKPLPAPYDGATIHGLFEHWATTTPDARAISFEGAHLTYKQLDERSNQLAHFLEANGVKEEQPVGVMLERSLELMIAMMGVLKAGGAFVPMDPEYPADRLALMAEDAEVPVLLSLSRIEAAIPLPPTAKRVNLDTDWASVAEYPAARPSQPRSHPHGLAYIIFTSGSTGRPKGTLLQHTGLINYLYYLISEHDLGGSDVFLQKTPISFDVSVRELFFPFSVGAELVFAVPGGHRDTQYLAELIAARSITCCSFVPSQLEIFLQEVDGVACKALRRVFVSGEALPPTSVAKFLELLPDAQLHNLYGPTEATVDVTGYDVRLHKGRATVPIGYPIANVKMYVLDPQLRPLPVGVPGELMISSRQLARGYIKRPDLSAEKFIDCPFGEGEYGKMYRTGDLARWLPEGVIEFLGRLDHQVKLRGFRIELGEIENGLCNCPGIRQAVVVVIKDHAGTSHLVAYVTPDVVDVPAAVRELAQNVPEYMVPEIIMPLAELPTLPNGKVNRRGLPEPDFSATATTDYVAPRNGIEEEIQDAWHEVFQIQPISMDADFFRIGGNSLLAGKVISRLRLAFHVELPFTSIFQHRTIADMALFIQSRLQQQPPTPAAGQAATASDDLSIPRYYGEKERCAGTLTSYSQELLLFNNELDPFNPVHNEAAWVRMRGDLDVAALMRALRYLVDRHSVLSSHFMIAGVKGPMLKQTRPSKFKMPVTYVDLMTGEELHAPEVMQRANSSKNVNVPSKIAKRRARLKTLKSSAAPPDARPQEPPSSIFSAGSVPKEEDEKEPAHGHSNADTAHITLPSAATRNLAAQVEQMHASYSVDDPEALARLRTWLRSGSGVSNDGSAAQEQAPRTPSATSSHSSRENLSMRTSDPAAAVEMARMERKPENGVANGQPVEAPKPVANGAPAPAEGRPLFTSHSSVSTGVEPLTPPDKQEAARPKAKSKSGCLSSGKPHRRAEPSSVSFASGKPVQLTAKPMDIEQSNDTVKEVEAIAGRVKKSLLLHWLTCGIYSSRQSGGSQGFWKGLKEDIAALCGAEPAETRKLREASEDEGGIMIPELASKKSVPSSALRDMLLREASQPFRIMHGPLLRARLIQVREGDHVLVITMHHAVTDGWSTGIIWRELSAAYNAFHRGSVSVGLPPLPVQYADFATWQRHWLSQGAMSEQMKFWRRHLGSARAVWDFPTDFFRPAVPSGTSERVPIRLKPAAVAAMKKLSGQVNATMFMALLAAYKVLLARYSSQETITCGLPYAGRSRAETEGLIGAFLGAVALHGELTGNPSFRQVMQRVRKSALEVFENADVPIHLVMVDILGLNGVGGCASPPLFQTMFFLHDSSWLEGMQLEGLSVDLPAKVEKNVARFDVTLEMTIDAAKDEVAGHVEYRTDLFRRKTIEALVKHFETLLDGIVAQPDASIWELPLLTADDRAVLDGARGVPPHLVPHGASARHAKPKIMSPKGYQMPVGLPGQLHISYRAEKKGGSLTKNDTIGLRHSSLMTMISGGFKKFFEDDKERERKGAPADGPHIPASISEVPGPSRSAQAFEVSSIPQRARPASPFGAEPEPSGASAPPPRLVGVRTDNSPVSSRTTLGIDETVPEQTIATGYTARVTREGKVEILGRISNKVEVAGVWTQLEDIDRQIEAASPQVEKAATVQSTDADGVSRLVAYVSPDTVDVAQLENALRDEVPSFQVPYLFQPLKRLPTLSHGEVDRSALPPVNWALKVKKPYLPPKSRLEMEVQLIWQAVMNKKEMISCDADFSDIGGNMMHAVIANGIVREALGVQMPAINIFRDRTIVTVAERIKQMRRKGRKAGHKHSAKVISLD